MDGKTRCVIKKTKIDKNYKRQETVEIHEHSLFEWSLYMEGEKLTSALKVVKVKTSLKSTVIHLISSTSQKYFHVCQYSVGRMRCHSWCFDESSVPYNDSDSRQAKRSFDSL